MRATLFAFLLALFSTPLAAQPLKLNSGKTVEILAVGPMHFTKSPPALFLRYQSALSLDDPAAARKEVDEIWQHLVGDADRGKFENAVIQANSPQTGFIIKTGKSYGFVFTKVDGIWRTSESEVTKDTKLTKAQLRAFCSRWDFLIENYNDRALSLYLDQNWRLKVSGAASSDGPQELTASQFLSGVAQGRGQTTVLEHRRDILSIKVDANANTATVESRETTRRHVKDRQMTLVEHTTDNIALRNGTLLILKSASTVEKFNNAVVAKP
jgi:hypothetical protein